MRTFLEEVIISPTIESPSRQPTNWRTMIPEKFSHCPKSSKATDFPAWDPAKGMRTRREFYLEGHWDLITELPHNWGNRLLEGKNKALCAPGERSSDPTRDGARLACECSGVPSGGVGCQ